MEKNRIRSVKTGKSMRMSYQRQKEVLEMPNLIEVQKDSYKWFLDEGLKEVFDDISPIADYGGKFSLEFIDFTYDAKDAKYTIAQCKERDVTYAAPLKVRDKFFPGRLPQAKSPSFDRPAWPWRIKYPAQWRRYSLR